MLDADLLQACLDQVQASLSAAGSRAAADEPEAVDEAADEPAESAEVAVDESAFDALDAVFAVEIVRDRPSRRRGGRADRRRAGCRLRRPGDCESGGNYWINTGNGYYGAYQFSLSTWQSLGYGGYPHEASPAVQDQAARELQALYGWSQWPGCSWYLGL